MGLQWMAHPSFVLPNIREARGAPYLLPHRLIYLGQGVCVHPELEIAPESHLWALRSHTHHHFHNLWGRGESDWGEVRENRVDRKGNSLLEEGSGRSTAHLTQLHEGVNVVQTHREPSCLHVINHPGTADVVECLLGRGTGVRGAGHLLPTILILGSTNFLAPQTSLAPGSEGLCQGAGEDILGKGAQSRRTEPCQNPGDTHMALGITPWKKMNMTFRGREGISGAFWRASAAASWVTKEATALSAPGATFQKKDRLSS